MRWKVSLYVGGKVFSDYCYATNRQNAVATALSRNPTARVISTNPEVERWMILQIKSGGKITSTLKQD